jgi:hypothetical protein
MRIWDLLLRRKSANRSNKSPYASAYLIALTVEDIEGNVVELNGNNRDTLGICPSSFIERCTNGTNFIVNVKTEEVKLPWSTIREIKITKAEKDALGAQITLNKGRVKHRLPNGYVSGTIAFGQARFNLDLWKVRKLSNIKTKQV